jgi:hypothetical protein
MYSALEYHGVFVTNTGFLRVTPWLFFFGIIQFFNPDSLLVLYLVVILYSHGVVLSISTIPNTGTPQWFFFKIKQMPMPCPRLNFP